MRLWRNTCSLIDPHQFVTVIANTSAWSLASGEQWRFHVLLHHLLQQFDPHISLAGIPDIEILGISETNVGTKISRLKQRIRTEIATTD